LQRIINSKTTYDILTQVVTYLLVHLEGQKRSPFQAKELVCFAGALGSESPHTSVQRCPFEGAIAKPPETKQT
jgi:hypothetical protein